MRGRLVAAPVAVPGAGVSGVTADRRRGVILPVVLMVLLLLALLGAMFSLRINADLASTRAMSLRLQTRLAAEAGIERVKQLLRDGRYDIDTWYHNPTLLHRIIVWTPDGDESVLGTNEEFDEPTTTFRFSIVADDPTDDEHRIRIGVTDEASKLNLNTATRKQLMILMRAVVGDDPEVDPGAIVDAILDWRDPDSDPRGDDPTTEGEYYLKRRPAYRIKNGPFDTVEELLLVKGVTPQILYGEDVDRNGLLTPNEDDGDLTYPPDNQDGKLDRGLYPYLTVYSAERNVSVDNRPRVYLFGDKEKLREALTEVFPDDPQVVDFIVQTARKPPAAPPASAGNSNTENAGDGSPPPSDEAAADEGNEGEPGGNTDNEGSSDEAGEGGEAGGNTENTRESSDQPDTSGGEGTKTDGEANQPPPIRSPASFLRDQVVNGQPVPSPVRVEHLPALLDRTTTVPPDQQEIPGRININTAPPLVLRCIDGLTPAQIEAIVTTRPRVPPEEKQTTAWLLTYEVVDLETFEKIEPQITARAQQFTIESLGYGDHTGMVTRLQAVVDFLGPIAQTVYYRDLTYLGARYPIREEDLEYVRDQ